MAPARATGLPAHTFPAACRTSKGEFSIAAYPRSPSVAGPLLEPFVQASSLYTFITRPCLASLPSQSPIAPLQQHASSKGGEQALGAFSKGGD
jgi:hypothetical protein